MSFYPVWLKENELMATATITTRPPLPPFTRESATQKVRLAEDRWNPREPEEIALAYAIDHDGGTARNSFVDERKIVGSLANGQEVGLQAHQGIVGVRDNHSPYGSPTSGTTTQVTGIAPMAVGTGF